MAQWVKDLALSLQQFRLMLWLDPWLGNFCMLQVQPKGEKKKSLPLTTIWSGNEA